MTACVRMVLLVGALTAAWLLEPVATLPLVRAQHTLATIGGTR